MAPSHHRRWGAGRGAASGQNKSGNNNINAQINPQSGTQGTGNGSYYGPQSTGRGRGSGPRNPGHAAAMASNQLPQGNTPLQSLTGIRPAWGEMSQLSSGTNDKRAQTAVGTSTTAPRVEMLKTTPTESMNTLLRRLREKDPTQITLADFTTKDSNDGKSVLITSLVNCIAALRPELGEAQWARIAAHAAIHHPSYLHEAYLDGDTAIKLSKSFLATRPMRLESKQLCPTDTPYLIVDTGLREHLGQLESTPSSELRRIITPFLQCFYPSDWELLEQTIRTAPDTQLQEFILSPGAMHEYFEGTNQRCAFDPPQWLSFASREQQGEKPSQITTHGSSDESDDDSVDSADLLHPLREMRIEQVEFDRLPPEIQKKKILAVFPTRMAQILPADVFGYMIVMLSEMNASSIHGAMDPLTFHRLTGHAKKTAIKAAELTPAPQVFHYRFRVQQLGKGYRSWANASASAILQSWVKAWIPMFAASRYTLALTKRPSDRHAQAIDLATLQDTPTQQLLDSYVYNVVRTKQGQLYQFDFWILTECPDVTNNGAQSFARSQERSLAYQDAIRKAAIWSMKMERFPQGYSPCIFLGNSLLKDDERIIKEEILLRTGFQPRNEDVFHVEWMTISTKSEQAHTMAHCIVTKPEDHQTVSKLGALLHPIQDVAFSITAEYQPLVLPLRRGPEDDQELSQAIARHQEYTRALTQVSIKDLPRTSICHYIPPDSGMEGIPSEHDATIAYLVMHGTIVMDDGTKMSSPVTRVNTDSKRTRLFLYAPRTSAGQLVLFVRGIYRLLVRWYEEDISHATLDIQEAEKLAIAQDRRDDQLHRQAQAVAQNSITETTAPTTASMTTTDTSAQHSPPQVAQQMVSIPQAQWNQAVQLLITSAAKMDKILSFMEQMPTVITHKDALDEAVSVITQSMTLNSDLVNTRADSTVMDTRRTLAARITEVDDHVSQLGSSLDSRHDQTAISMTRVIKIVGEVLTKFDNTEGNGRAPENDGIAEGIQGAAVMTGSQGVSNDIIADVSAPQGEVTDGMEENRATTTGPTTEAQTHSAGPELAEQPRARTAAPSAEVRDGHEDPAHTAMPQEGEAGEHKEKHDEQEEDWERKYSSESDTEDDQSTPAYKPITRCHACNKLDADIEVCDYCEIPHHLECLIQEPNKGTNRYCNECIKLLYGEDQKMPSQSSMTNSDLELSEPESSSDDSEVSEFRPTTMVAPTSPADVSSQPQNIAPKYALRPRKRQP